MESSECRKKVKIVNKLGLHARPAALFVEAASKYMSHIMVRKGSSEVNGKSIMGMMMLAAGIGTVLEIIAVGADSEEAVATLEKLILDKFHEEA